MFSAKLSIASTLVFISSRTSLTSESPETSTYTTPYELAAVDLITSMPCKSLSASSIGIQTPFSTSSGVAPGYGILTETTLVEVSGNISFLSFSQVEIPANKTKAIIKLAATLLRENHFIKLRIN